MSGYRFVLWLVAFCLWASSGAFAVNNDVIMANKPAQKLSEYGLFKDPAARSTDASLFQYDLNNPLFTDYALKIRYIYIPPEAGPALIGKSSEVLAFPIGTVLVKTFAYPQTFEKPDENIRFIETRLLIHKKEGWKAYPYIWNAAQNEATLKVAGKRIDVPVVWKDGSADTINYAVPNMNQCKGCHGTAENKIGPIGPKVRNINRLGINRLENQITLLQERGYLAETTQSAAEMPRVANPFDSNSGRLFERARSYLDGNCAHCHAPGRPGDTSGLYLNYEEERDVHWGLRKPPVAAGRGAGGLRVDIEPGDADKSILYYRMNSTDPGIMMPELGRSLIDKEGVTLIREFIESLD